jgi:hypothetical protein
VRIWGEILAARLASYLTGPAFAFLDRPAAPSSIRASSFGPRDWPKSHEATCRLEPVGFPADIGGRPWVGLLPTGYSPSRWRLR